MTGTSLVSKDNAPTLDLGKLIRFTNRAQAVALILADDPLVPAKAREFYDQANEMLKKAMLEACEASKG